MTKRSTDLNSVSDDKPLCVAYGSRKKGKKIAKFYTAQNEQISSLLKPLSTLSAEGEEDAKNNALSVKIAVNLSFGCNIVLAIVQLYAAIASGSLALFASCVDSGTSMSLLVCGSLLICSLCVP